MILAIKLILLISLLIIFYQDIRMRAVWWFLFPAFLLTSGYLHFLDSPDGMFVIFSGLNFLFMSIILSISFLYAQYKMKVKFFKEAFGLGDLLFFLGLTVAFPTMAFIVVLVFSLLFSLVLHLFFDKSGQSTVPLAGYASLFLILVYLTNWTGIFKNLYHI